MDPISKNVCAILLKCFVNAHNINIMMSLHANGIFPYTRGICGKHILHVCKVVNIDLISFFFHFVLLISFYRHSSMVKWQGEMAQQLHFFMPKEHLRVLSSPPTVLWRSRCAATPPVSSIPLHLAAWKQCFTAYMCTCFRSSEVRSEMCLAFCIRPFAASTKKVTEQIFQRKRECNEGQLDGTLPSYESCKMNADLIYWYDPNRGQERF